FQPLPGAAVSNVVGLINFPQKFRSQADIGAKLGIFSGRLTWNHLASYTNTTVTPVQKVSNYDTFDLGLNVEVNERLRIGFDVRNLLNEDPPFVDTTRGYDPQSANPIPRMFSMTAGVKF
ncbi:MAG: TonB-dependent receptor, partial [Novosphingobium sp.]